MSRWNIAVFLMLGVTLSILDICASDFKVTFHYDVHIAGSTQCTAGDVIRLADGHIVLMKDNNNGIYVQKGGWKTKWTTAKEIKLNPDTKYFKVEVTNRLPPETSIALAQRLVNKRLPHGYIFCDHFFYICYILGAGTYTNCFRRDCPLALPLRTLTPTDINSNQFKLKNGYNRLVAVDSLLTFESGVSAPVRKHARRKSKSGKHSDGGQKSTTMNN